MAIPGMGRPASYRTHESISVGLWTASETGGERASLLSRENRPSRGISARILAIYGYAKEG